MLAVLVGLYATAAFTGHHASAEVGDDAGHGTITEPEARPVFPMAGTCAEILVAVDQALFGTPDDTSAGQLKVTSALLLMQAGTGYSASEWFLDGVADRLPSLEQSRLQACRTAIDSLGEDDTAESGRLNLKAESEDSALVSLLADKMSWRFDPASHAIWYSLGPPNRAWPASALFEAEALDQAEGFVFPAGTLMTSAADISAMKVLLENLVRQDKAAYDTWPYLLGAVILSSVFAILLTYFWQQARSNRNLLMQLVKAGEARENELEQRAVSQVNRIADYLVQETRALAASVHALERSLRGGRQDEVSSRRMDAEPSEEPDEDTAGHWEPALAARRGDHELPAEAPRQASGLIPEVWRHWSGQRSGPYDLEALIQIYNSWLLSDRDMKDFPAEMGLIEANGVRYRAAEPYGALLLPQGSGSGISLFVLALSPEEAIGLPGADMVVGSFRSGALRERSKPFFNVEIGKSARLRVVKPCSFLQQDERHCVLTEPGILTAKA